MQAGVGARQGFDWEERDEEGQAGVEVGTLAAKATSLRVEGMDGRSGRVRISKRGVDMRGEVGEDRTSKQCAVSGDIGGQSNGNTDVVIPKRSWHFGDRNECQVDQDVDAPSAPAPDRQRNLWPGHRWQVDVPHSRGRVLRGEFASPRPTGTCVVQAFGVPLWAIIAPTLGLRVVQCFLENPSWNYILEKSGVEKCALKIITGPTLRHCCTTPVDIVFDEVETLPHRLSYWTQSTPPHVVLLKPHVNVFVPPTWHLRSLSLNHASLGGATDGSWSVGVIHRTEDLRFTHLQLSAITVAPGRLRDVIDPMIPGRSCAPPGEQDALPDGVFDYDRLFPLAQRQSPIFRLPHHMARSGWVTRELQMAEFLHLWDLPIIPREAVRAVDVPAFTAEIRRHAPCKIFFEAGALLLGNLDRGGF